MGNLAICDSDESYVRCITEYFCSRGKLPFSIYGFSKEKKLLEFLKTSEVEILLISSKMINEKIQLSSVKKIILLSDGEVVEEGSDNAGYDTIYKFQSSENIIREVMECYSKMNIEYKKTAFGTDKADIIGVYSPVSRCGKTTFAITLGQILARDRNVLLISTEEFSGLRILIGKDFTGDLSDLLYYLKLNPQGLGIKIKALTNSIRGLDIIPPMIFSADLRGMDISQWRELVEYISCECEYDTIIIDVGGALKNQIDMLDMCDKVYMPVLDDIVSKAKIREFEHFLIKSAKEQILFKVQKLQLPKLKETFMQGDYIEQLCISDVGIFADTMLGEGDINECGGAAQAGYSED